MTETAKQRAALHILDLLARYPPTLNHKWSEREIAELMIEITKIEMGLRRVAVGGDAKACKAMNRESGHQVRMRRVKGVK